MMYDASIPSSFSELILYSIIQALPSVIQISLTQMESASSRSLRLANLESLINAVLYNPPAALHVMETTSAGSSRQFFDKWFIALKSPSGLPRVHDKKLCIMTMCALLEMDPASVPAPLQEGWAGIVSAVLHVFQSLPEAEESKYLKRGKCLSSSPNFAHVLQ